MFLYNKLYSILVIRNYKENTQKTGKGIQAPYTHF